MKTLCCGCCGSGFLKWDGYIDQDQDKGYGICQPCQDSVATTNKAAMDDGIKLLTDNLNPANKAKFLAMDRGLQESVVHHAIEDRVITWSIGGRS